MPAANIATMVSPAHTAHSTTLPTVTALIQEPVSVVIHKHIAATWNTQMYQTPLTADHA